MPLLELVVPVHNEQLALRRSIQRLHAHVQLALPDLDVRITIADNASTDQTAALARQLTEELPGVGLLELPQKGRGRALRAAWSASDAELVAYMDVDLSTELAAFAPLVRPGARATPSSWPTWTSISRPTWRRSRRWCGRCFGARPTLRSARG
jgi:glycosyltransferase involved in cell wall biosynthesis